LSPGVSAALLSPLSSASQSTRPHFFQHEELPQACSYPVCSADHPYAAACAAEAGVSAAPETYDVYCFFVVYHCLQPAPILHGKLSHSSSWKCAAVGLARPQLFWLTGLFARQRANDGAGHRSVPEDVPTLPGRWCLLSSRPAEVYLWCRVHLSVMHEGCSLPS